MEGMPGYSDLYVYWFIAAAEVLGRVQLISKLNSNLSGAEITSNFSTYK